MKRLLSFAALAALLLQTLVTPPKSRAQRKDRRPDVRTADRSTLRPDDAVVQPPRLSGGFIQLGDPERRLPRAKWGELLGEMRDRLRMDTVLIQALFSEDDAGKHCFINLSKGQIDAARPHYDSGMVLAVDPTDAMLEYADRHGVDVYVGLWMADLQYGTVAGEPDVLEHFLDEAAGKSNAAAEIAWNLYHRHPSFKGWYIAYELWNFPFGDRGPKSVRKQELFRQFLRRVSHKCRELNARKESDGKARDRSVAVSAFFNPWFDRGAAGPDVTKDVFSSVLADSGINTFILQDSVGAKCLGSEKLDGADRERTRELIKGTTMPEYLTAFYEAVKVASGTSHNIHLWYDVEAYETASGRCPTPEASQPFRPSDIGRLKWQFSVATIDPRTGEPYADPGSGDPVQFFEKFLVFDTFHYMNTVVPDGFGTATANTVALRTKLFDDYKREFVNQSFNPAVPKARTRAHR